MNEVSLPLIIQIIDRMGSPTGVQTGLKWHGLEDRSGMMRFKLEPMVVLCCMDCFVVTVGITAAAKADGLVAGPLPANIIFTDKLSCSAINLNTAIEGIGVTLVDATGSGLVADCFSLDPNAACTVTFNARKIGSGKSPFSCFIGGSSNKISGTFCVEHLTTLPPPPLCVNAVPIP